MGYNTENRMDDFREIMVYSSIFLRPKEASGEDEEILAKGTQQYDSIKDTLDTFTCSLEPKTEPEPTSKPFSVNPPTTIGGAQSKNNYNTYGGFEHLSRINKANAYNNIDNFIDINSLKGIYILHKYNMYANIH